MNADIKLILIGWLLGILSTLISTLVVHFIQKLFKKNSIKSGLILELKDAHFRIAMIAYKMRMRFGKLNKEFIETINNNMTKMNHNPNYLKLAEMCNRQLNYTDEDFAKLNIIDKAEPGISLAMKTYDLPYLESKISDLTLFSEKFQYHCLSILHEVRLLNQAIEESTFYYRVSYTAGLTDKTYEIASMMTEKTFEHIGERAEIICKAIINALKDI